MHLPKNAFTHQVGASILNDVNYVNDIVENMLMPSYDSKRLKGLPSEQLLAFHAQNVCKMGAFAKELSRRTKLFEESILALDAELTAERLIQKEVVIGYTREKEKIEKHFQARLVIEKSSAVEEYKASAEFDRVNANYFFDGFEEFRQQARATYEDLDFQHFQPFASRDQSPSSCLQSGPCQGESKE
ncbi:uncharacterized protein LOC132307389 [Cornus florida]|uniref:uncharacterized protein LOC132307389 n=1 Tax=Cornus florida TaxID=4283 RepID=UPI0028A050A0|nr:uncharacterized protein LOC132307389 [Cornus florida]